MVRRLAILLAALVAVAASIAGTASARAAVRSGSGSAHASVRHSTRRHCKATRRRVHGRVVRSCSGRGYKAIATRAPAKRHHTTAPASGSHGSATGSSSTAVTAAGTTTNATSATPAWPAQPHTETWAYDDCANGGSSAPASIVRGWLTFAEANCGPGGDQKALSDCHAGSTTACDVIQYLDTNWIYPNGSPTWTPFSAAASSSWYQHTPGSTSNQVTSTGYGGGYLINQSSSAVQSFFQSYVRNHYAGEDGLMMDDQSPGLGAQLYYSSCHCSSTNEVGSDAALLSAHTAMSAAMTRASGQHYLQIDNTLPPNPYQPQGLGMLSQSNNVQGLIAEGEPEYNGTLDPYYSTLLDQIAYVANRSSGFVVPLSYGDAGASYQQQSRRVQEATILLGYKPGRLVDWANLEQGSSDLAVWPEEGIYPTAPVQTMAAPGGSGCLAGTGVVCSTGGHNSVQVAPGVYRREFGACYNHGVAFGACAAIVNTTGAPVTIRSSWLSHSYAHQITFSGGDVQSGGTVNLADASFTANSTTVGAQDAVMLAS